MKKDKGNFICLGAGALHIAAAAALLFKLFENTAYDFYLISSVVVAGGLLSVAAFLSMGRCRFRPGWLLSQGLTGIFVGVMMFAALFIGRINMDFILLFSLPCIAIITAILHISASFQIKCLGFQRWWILLAFGMADILFGVSTYFYFLAGDYDVHAGFGIFFILLALQFVAETVTYKITVNRDDMICD